MTLAIARDRYGACPRCTPITWHDGPCPFWGEATERERSVPCSSCRRPTFRNDAQCSRCAASLPGRARDRGQGAPPHPAPTPLTAAERAARNERTAAAVERVLAVSALDWPVQAPQAPRPVR